MKLQQGAALVIPDLRVEVDVHQCHSWKCIAMLYQQTRTEMVKMLQHILHKLTALSQWFSHSRTADQTTKLSFCMQDSMHILEFLLPETLLQASTSRRV